MEKNVKEFVDKGEKILDGYIRPLKGELKEEYQKMLKACGFLDTEEIYASTAFGDLLAIDHEGYVFLLDLLNGMKTVICANAELFFSLINDSEYQKDYFRIEAYRYAINMFGELDESECFIYEPIPALGGEMNRDDISKGKTREYIQLLISFM